MSIQKKLIENILSSYEVITENKNFLFEVTDSYSNIEFKNIGLGNPASDNISTELLQDIQTAAKSAGVNVSVTTAVTGHGSKTKSGKPSRHTTGQAVDIAMINGKAVSSSNRADADKLVAALVSMGYTKNTEGPNNPKAVLTFGFEGHDNHVHVSNTTGNPSQAPVTSTSGNTTDNNTSADTQIDTSSSTIGTTGAKDFAKTIGSSLLNAIGIKESFAKSSFGKNIQTKGGKVLIPKNSNEKIKSPVSGKIVDIMSNSSCLNQIVIEYNDGYLEYCGIKSPSVKTGQKVGVGTVLGNTNTNVTVTMYSEKKRKESIDLDKTENKKNKGPKNEPKNQYSRLLVKGYHQLKKSFDTKKDDKKLDENIKRIKGLL